MKFIKTLQGQVFSKPPIWLMRQAGRYLPEYRALRQQAPDFVSFCLNPEMAVEATLQPLRRFDFDAAIIFSDILIVPYGLGQHVEFKTGEGPCLGPLPHVENFDPNIFHKRVAPVYNAISLVRQQLPSHKALIGFAGAPWTVLTYMCEGGPSKSFDLTRELILGHPDVFENLLESVVEMTTQYLLRQIQAGANAIQIFDSWAGQIPAYLHEKLIFQPTSKIVQTLKNAFPNIPIIGFPRGLSYILNDYITQTNVTAVSLDTFILPENVKCSCPIQGGLDPIVLVTGGKILQEHVYRYLQAFQNVPYVFNLGHGILPHTPLENVEHLFKVIDQFEPSI